MDWDDRQPYYLYEGAKVALEIVDDEIIVGLHPGEMLFDLKALSTAKTSSRSKPRRSATTCGESRSIRRSPP